MCIDMCVGTCIDMCDDTCTVATRAHMPDACDFGNFLVVGNILIIDNSMCYAQRDGCIRLHVCVHVAAHSHSIMYERQQHITETRF